MSEDDTYRRINYRLCTAIDLLKLGMVLDEMVEAGFIGDAERRCSEMQARGLLGSLRNLNQRAAGESPASP